MVRVIVFICTLLAVVSAQTLKHKSEAQIAAMSPEQRVEEWVTEYVEHRFVLGDRQRELIRNYLERDALTALPRLIQIIDEYDPTRSSGMRGSKGERFDACFQILSFIDGFVIRIRSTDDGRRAISALEKAISRMEAAGYRKLDNNKWEKDRLELAESYLTSLKGINLADRGIKDTLRHVYKTVISDTELVEFTSFLIGLKPEYPGWSKSKMVKDYSQINEAGNPLWIRVMDSPERYYKAYVEFKKKPAN